MCFPDPPFTRHLILDSVNCFSFPKESHPQVEQKLFPFTFYSLADTSYFWKKNDTKFILKVIQRYCTVPCSFKIPDKPSLWHVLSSASGHLLSPKGLSNSCLCSRYLHHLSRCRSKGTQSQRKKKVFSPPYSKPHLAVSSFQNGWQLKYPFLLEANPLQLQPCSWAVHRTILWWLITFFPTCVCLACPQFIGYQ